MRDGAGILPIFLYKNKLYLLFGRERESKLWSDFGGARDTDESLLKCAIREGYEETTGILGDENEIGMSLRLRCIATLELDNYVTYVYSPANLTISQFESIPLMFDRVDQFVQSLMPQQITDGNGLFEKDKVKWFTVSESVSKISLFRPFYQPLIDHISKIESYLVQKLVTIERG